MNNFIAFTFIMLAWVFFEQSGGFDFDPAAQSPAQNDLVASSRNDNFGFRDGYVPFDAPVITSAPAKVTDVVLASYSGEETTPAPALDIRIIAGDRVNLRTGPSTTTAIVDTVTRGTKAEVLTVNNNDWAQIRLLDTDKTAWVAAWLLNS